MGLHWASPSAFVPIVTALLARENPGVEIRQFQGGGLTSTRAYDRFFADAIAWKPDVVLLVVMNRTDADLEKLALLGRGLTAAGAKVYAFDDVHDPDTADPARLREGARGGAGQRDRHRRGGRDPVVGARPRSLPEPGWNPHDGALSSAHGQGMAEALAGARGVEAER